MRHAGSFHALPGVSLIDIAVLTPIVLVNAAFFPNSP